jgi:hypothetical protein
VTSGPAAPGSAAWRWLSSVVAVQAPAAVLARLTELAGPPTAAPATAQVTVDDAGRVRAGDRIVLESGDPLEGALTGLNAVALDQATGFAVHAGVVAQADGGCLAFPAVSGAGKSTLTAACVLRGAAYVSDEALVAPWHGGPLVPYRRPLGLSAWSLRALGLTAPVEGTEGHLPATVLDGGRGLPAAPLRLAHLVLPRRGHPGPPELAPLPRGTAAMELLTRSFNHFTRPPDAFRTATRLARDAQCWWLDYGDPLVAADLLLARLR